MLYRKILNKIWRFIDSPDILLLNGARQVGKTTLLYMLKDKLTAERHVPETHVHWFDLEKVEDLTIWSNQITALATLPLKATEHHYIFIDEFQKSPSIGSTLKVLHDHYPQFKIIITGSASWYLTLDESMAGRKHIFHIYPLTFHEYLTWKSDAKLLSLYEAAAKTPETLAPPVIFLLNNAFLEFVAYGGYPAVVAASSKEEKVRILSELINSYLLRDIQLSNYAVNSLQVKKILTLLASRVASLLDIPSLSLDVQLGRSALLNRLELLQNTFLLSLVGPYFTNKAKELVKNPKIYLVDTGLRGFLLNNFSVLPQTSDFGYVAENVVAGELQKSADELDELHYWRTKIGVEVDVVKKREGAILPIEVKAGDAATIPHGLKSFIRTYQSQKAYVLNWSIAQTLQYESCTVMFRPLWFPIA